MIFAYGVAFCSQAVLLIQLLGVATGCSVIGFLLGGRLFLFFFGVDLVWGEAVTSLLQVVPLVTPTHLPLCEGVPLVTPTSQLQRGPFVAAVAPLFQAVPLIDPGGKESKCFY